VQLDDHVQFAGHIQLDDNMLQDEGESNELLDYSLGKGLKHFIDISKAWKAALDMRFEKISYYPFKVHMLICDLLIHDLLNAIALFFY